MRVMEVSFAGVVGSENGGSDYGGGSSDCGASVNHLCCWW